MNETASLPIYQSLIPAISQDEFFSKLENQLFIFNICIIHGKGVILQT